jgi:antitoxin component YwqK of YwqJK toxin-antitoxin module
LGSLIYLVNLIPNNEHFLYGNDKFHKNGEKLYFENNAFTGKTIEVFPDGSTYRKSTYFQGELHGEQFVYATTGALKARYNYKNNKKHGLQRTWFLEGPLKSKMYYTDGILHGKTSEWYMTGTLYRNQEFHYGEEKAQKVLYRTGEVFSNYVIRDGRIYGKNSGQLCMDFKKEGEI